MYLPAAFHSDDREGASALIDHHPLATLVMSDAQGLLVNHLPLMRDPAAPGLVRLIGHLAAANPLAGRLAGATEVLAVFQGTQGYISPSWYATKAEHGKVVPTWNYAVVHLRVRAETVNDEAGKRAIVETLTDRFERERAQPWAVGDAPEDFVRARLAGIIGLRLLIESITFKAKLSQNQPPVNVSSLLSGLRAEGCDTMAEAIEAAKPARP
ncbi:MAG: FMN-binding negative transcriptional regulator [Burkholderiaceae bacterium]